MSTAPSLSPNYGSEDLRAGRVLGRYELLVPIAAGGMAQVWAARLRGARQFQKIVAVKTMLPKLSEDAQFEQMFLDEASLASQVRHPNVVEIMDLGEEAGVLFLVMEWIEGVPLNQLMKAAKERGGIPPQVATRIALHACAGLHAAHELNDEKGQAVGLVHRDVSPQNLLVTFDGVTKVVDFGVAKATALGGGATVAGQVKGKVSYMAPEQVNGLGLDRRADVFALGIVLYALTTGKHPFRRESEAATMFAICSPDAVTPPSRVLPGYPVELEPIVLKALEKDRDRRYSSCDEMLRALDGLPSHLRVSSDGDVAVFVRELFGSKRAEQKKRIDDAILRVESDASDPALWPGGQLASQVTGRVSLPSVTAHELSAIPSGIVQQRTRNRIVGVLGLSALALSGAVLFRTLRSAPPEPGPAQSAVAAPIPPAKEEAAPEPKAQLPALDASSLPVEKQAIVTDPKPAPAPSAAAEPVPQGAAPQGSSKAGKAPSSTSPQGKKAPKQWQMDAGF